MSKLTDALFERAIAAADVSFKNYQYSGPRGQQARAEDDWNWHFARAIESELSKQESDEELRERFIRVTGWTPEYDQEGWLAFREGARK